MAERSPKLQSAPVAKIAVSGNGFDAHLLRRAPDANLADSVRENGIIEPVTLECWRGGFRVIAGFRRVAAARAAGLVEIPAAIYDEGALEPRQAFRVALASNAPGLSLNDADRATALAKAAEIGFSRDDLIDEVAPRLGLVASHKVVNQYLGIARLPEAVLDRLSGDSISREHAVAICLIPADERAAFFERFVEAMRLSANDTRLVAEAALDLAARSGEQPLKVLDTVAATLENAPGHPRKAALKEVLAAAARPISTGMEEEFASLLAELDAPPAVSINHAPGFESDGIDISVKAAGLDDLAALGRVIKHGIESGVFERMLSIAKRRGAKELERIREEASDGRCAQENSR